MQTFYSHACTLRLQQMCVFLPVCVCVCLYNTLEPLHTLHLQPEEGNQETVGFCIFFPQGRPNPAAFNHQQHQHV